MPEPRLNRVLMTADTVGGVWTFALELAEALGEHGIEVMLAALGGEPSDAQCAEAGAIPNLRLAASSYKLEWMEDPWADVEASGRWLLELEARFSPDVIHLNSFGHGALPWKHPVTLTAHSCVVSWWAAVRGTELPAEWNRYRELVERSVRAAAIVTAPSRAMLRSVANHYSPGGAHFAVVPNGRRPDRFHGVGTAEARRKENFVFAAGRLWDEAKNLGSLAEIAPTLPWPVALAGDEQGPNGAWPAASSAGFHSLGRLGPAALADWYGRAAIYAFPARYEPFGLSILEAALSGCALVLGDIESLRENWDAAAVFTPPDDPQKLASALRGLMANPAQREELAARSQARAAQFTAARMAAAYLALYRRSVEEVQTACAS